MYWFKSLLVLLVTCFIELTSTIECYSCKSDEAGDCGDPFDDEKKSKAEKCTDFSMGLETKSEAQTCMKTEVDGKGTVNKSPRVNFKYRLQSLS